MEEKFLKLSSLVRWIIVFLLWAITVIALVGCLLVKKYLESYVVEILLSCVGILFCVIAICFTIMQLTGKEKTENEEK